MRADFLIKDITEQFSKIGLDTPSMDARMLVSFALKVKPVVLRITPDFDVSDDAFQKIQDFVKRRLAFEPVAKIIETKGFWSLDLKVTQDVLDPRPDSETLIEAVLSRFPDKSQNLSILDIGTGSGCLALALLVEYPNAMAEGIDISPKALEIARQNALSNGLSKRFVTRLGDFKDLKENKTFDVVISNPPYIPQTAKSSLAPDVVLYDPSIALFGGFDGLDAYRFIAPKLSDLLKDQGVAVFEFGYDQAKEVQSIFSSIGLCFDGFQTDLGGITRCLVLKKTTKY